NTWHDSSRKYLKHLSFTYSEALKFTSLMSEVAGRSPSLIVSPRESFQFCPYSSWPSNIFEACAGMAWLEQADRIVRAVSSAKILMLPLFEVVVLEARVILNVMPNTY